MQYSHDITLNRIHVGTDTARLSPMLGGLCVTNQNPITTFLFCYTIESSNAVKYVRDVLTQLSCSC